MAEPKKKARRKIPDDEMYEILSTMIGLGNTGLVQPMPCGRRVKKIPVPWDFHPMQAEFQCEQIRREIQVYKHLPAGHRRLVRMLEYEDDGDEGVSITLEFMPNYSLQRYLAGGSKYVQRSEEQKERGAAIPLRQRASWALEATDAVVLLHAHGVIHADLRPDNMVLDARLGLRIIDLSGSSLQGSKALSLESAAFFMPRTPENENGKVGCTVVTDLFALGSCFYQMATCYQPWEGDDHTEIEARYARGEFPDLTSAGADGSPLLFADIIRRCWHGEFASASDLLEALKDEIRATFSGEDQAFIEQQSGIPLYARLEQGPETKEPEMPSAAKT